MANLLNDSFDFIARLENYDLYKRKYSPVLAYWDISRWSIGFGNKSVEGEQISYLQAVDRCKTFIQKDLINVLFQYDWMKKLNFNQQIAVLSYCYQYGVGGFLKSGFYDFIKNGKNPTLDWANSQSYKSRRIAEVNKFNERISPAQWIANLSTPVKVVFILGLLSLFYVRY